MPSAPSRCSRPLLVFSRDACRTEESSLSSRDGAAARALLRSAAGRGTEEPALDRLWRHLARQSDPGAGLRWTLGFLGYANRGLDRLWIRRCRVCRTAWLG